LRAITISTANAPTKHTTGIAMRVKACRRAGANPNPSSTSIPWTAAQATTTQTGSETVA
jgi:hypothetical protein